MTTASVGADHVDTAADHRALDEAQLALGRPAEARAVLHRALARIPAERLTPRAAVQFHRARARWALGERAAARSEAEEALAVLRGSHGTTRVPAATVEAWLAQHPAPRR